MATPDWLVPMDETTVQVKTPDWLVDKGEVKPPPATGSSKSLAPTSPVSGTESLGKTIGEGLYEIGAQPFRMAREAVGGFTGALGKGFRNITDVIPAQLGAYASGAGEAGVRAAGREAEEQSRAGRGSVLSPVYNALEAPMRGATPSWLGRGLGKVAEGAVGVATGMGVPRELAQDVVGAAGDIGALAGGKYAGSKLAGAVREAGGVTPFVRGIPESVKGVPTVLRDRFSGRQPGDIPKETAQDWLRMRSLSGDVFGSSSLDPEFKAQAGVAGFGEVATDTTSNAAKIIHDSIQGGTKYSTVTGKLSGDMPKTFIDNAIATQTVLDQKNNLSRAISREAIDRASAGGVMPEYDITSGSPLRQQLLQKAHDTLSPETATAMRRLLDSLEGLSEGGELTGVKAEPTNLGNAEKTLTRLRDEKRLEFGQTATPQQKAARILYDDLRNWTNDNVARLVPEKAGEWAKLRQEEAILHSVSDHVRSVGEQALLDAGAKRGVVERFGRLISSLGGRELVAGAATGHHSLALRGAVTAAGELSKGAFKKLDKTVGEMYKQVGKMSERGELFPYEQPKTPKPPIPGNASQQQLPSLPPRQGGIRSAAGGIAPIFAAEQERSKKQWGRTNSTEEE